MPETFYTPYRAKEKLFHKTYHFLFKSILIFFKNCDLYLWENILGNVDGNTKKMYTILFQFYKTSKIKIFIWDNYKVSTKKYDKGN